MLSRLLNHRIWLSVRGGISGGYKAHAILSADGQASKESSPSVGIGEQNGKFWALKAGISISKGTNVSRASPQAFRTMQNGGMSQILSPEEVDVLTILNEAFPEKLHLHQLAPRTSLNEDPSRLLQIVDGLFVRGLIEGKPLRGPEGLADAANLIISAAGTEKLNHLSASDNETVSAVPLKPAQASILNVLIASPSDVGAERDAVVSAIHEWNSSHYVRTGIMLHPVRWETHSYPAAGDRPQGLLNRQIVDSAHFLIGIFGSRLGTPTGEAESGTIEEIEQFRRTGRHVALYFSNAPVARTADRVQLEALEKYQSERQRDSLYFTYGNAEDLRRLVTQHLPKIITGIEEAMGKVSVAVVQDNAARTKPKAPSPRRNRPGHRAMSIEDIGELSPKEIELLWNAAKDPDGDLLHSNTFDGEGLRTNGRHFLKDADIRAAAEWLAAFRLLEDRGLIAPLSDERSFFKVTGEGYGVADELEDFAHWDASSVVIRAHYMNAKKDEISLQCKRVIAIPATYYPDQVGADRFVTRNLKERRSLLVEGVSPKPLIDWTPNEVEFTDTITGRCESFRVEGATFTRPGTLTLPIVS
jgi:hypothetical protein